MIYSGRISKHTLSKQWRLNGQWDLDSSRVQSARFLRRCVNALSVFAVFCQLCPDRPLKKAMAELGSIMEEIKDAYCELDPINDPKVQFDPSNPDTAGRMVALAFISQDKVSLANIRVCLLIRPL